MKWLAVLAGLWLAMGAARAQDIPNLSLGPTVDLVADALVLEGDPASAEDSRYPHELRAAWAAAHPVPPRPPYSSRWLIARIVNPAGSTATQWVLRMDTDPLYLPHLVVLDGSRAVAQAKREDAVSIGAEPGAAIAIGQRFAVTVPAGESRVVALRVSAISYGSLAADLMPADAYVRWAARHQALVMTALGLLTAVGAYNLLLGLGIRSSTYVWYAAHAGSHLAYWATLYGLTADLAGFTDHDRVVYKLSSTATFMAAPFFVRGLLEPKAFAPLLDRLLRWCGWAGLALMVPVLALAPWPQWQAAWVRGTEWQFVLALVETPIFLLTGLLALRHRVAGAAWFLMGWGTYLAAILSLVFATYGVWRFSGDWLLAGLLGATWEAVMLSQALAGRISAVHRARLASEARLVAQEGLLAAVSHELRTPLNAILGMTRLLGQEALPQRALRRVQTIQRAGETLLGMVSNLLDRASLDAGRFRLVRAPARLSAIVEETCALMRDLASGKGLALTAELDDALPEWLVLDGLRIKQVLIGLIDNAVKYTDVGRITVSASAMDGRLVLAVADTGKGVPMADRERIFDRFHRGAGEDAPGVGLGLAIARDLVAAMGGRLSVDDAPGGGARFAFDLPLEPAPPLLVPVERALSVLLVDDLEVNREVAASLLRNEGHEAVTAPPEDAIVQLLSREVDVVVMDVNMPVLDGPELARRIRALPDRTKAGIPILALSAGIQPMVQAQLARLGVVEYLPKPLAPGAIQAAFARTLAAAPAIIDAG